MRLASLLVAALSLTTSAAIAQRSMPVTVEIKEPGGRVVGTATRSGNMIVYRDARGEIAGSSTIAADGKQTHYDPHGKVVASPSIVNVPDPEEPHE
jgi:Tfp pilus assembly protein FimT